MSARLSMEKLNYEGTGFSSQRKKKDSKIIKLAIVSYPLYQFNSNSSWKTITILPES